MFEARSYIREKHFPLISEWALDRGLEVPDPNQLPPVGCVVYYSDLPVCAGFLFDNGTPAMVMANLMSDKFCDKQVREKAVDFMILELAKAAKDFGKKQLLCSTNIEPAKKHFEKLGFKIMSENVTIYRRDLCHSGG